MSSSRSFCVISAPQPPTIVTISVLIYPDAGEMNNKTINIALHSVYLNPAEIIVNSFDQFGTRPILVRRSRKPCRALLSSSERAAPHQFDHLSVERAGFARPPPLAPARSTERWSSCRLLWPRSFRVWRTEASPVPPKRLLCQPFVR